MADSLFSQPPVAYFQPLPSSLPNTRTPSFIACETPACDVFGNGGLTEFETISSKVCDWAGELGKDHDLRQGADHCAWLFSEQAAPFQVSKELPSGALIPAAQRQPRVDFVSSAAAMKNLFWAACEEESDVGVTVHRLGDWLLIDDGAEIPTCFSAGHAARGAGQLAHAEESSEDCRRRAEQRHIAARARAEAAEARAAEAHRRLEDARAALWQAEVEVQQAQELLRESFNDVAEAAGECERLRAKCARGASSSHGPKSTPLHEEEPGDFVGSRLRSFDAAEDRRLYENFLGHSIRLFRDESCESQERDLTSRNGGPLESSGTSAAAPGQDLVARDSAPAFRQVGLWKIADDASVVVGSNMVCLGNAEHPKLTLYLHSTTVVSDMMLLEHCLECLIAGVPEFAICYHRDGAVQSYTLYKLSELWPLLEAQLAIGRKIRMMLEVLRWIKRQCCFEGCTYWLSKSKDEPTIKLFRLSGGACGNAHRGSRRALVPVEAPVPSALGTAADLVLKNTFLHFLGTGDEDVDACDLRRTQSCPARVYGPITVEDTAATTSERCSELSLRSGVPLPLKAFRHRISALFFRRAVSSSLGADAMRFFQYALDLAADDSIDAQGIGSCGGGEEEGLPFLRACCHLSLALCQLAPGGSTNVGDRHASGGAGESSAEAVALAQALREDAPHHLRRVGMVESDGQQRYVLWPLRGRVRRSQLVFMAIPQWPESLQGAANAVGGDATLRSGSGHDEEDDAFVSQPSSPFARVPRTQTAVLHLADAFALLTLAQGAAGDGLPDCDRECVEALAFPIASLTLLRLASDMIRMTLDSKRGIGGRAETTLAWRALTVARQFAALAFANSVYETRPFFACLPSAESLLVRVEHLSGGVLLTATSCSNEDASNARSDDRFPGAEVEFVRLRCALSVLERWISIHWLRSQAAANAVSRQLRRASTLASNEAGGNVSFDARPSHVADVLALPWHKRRETAVWYYENSIRLLPKSMQRGCMLLHHMMMVLASALIEAATSLADTIDVGAISDAGACSDSLRAAVTCDRQLDRAEELAEATGHQVVSALVLASRSHLRSLAADILVSRALPRYSASSTSERRLSEEDVDGLEELLSHDADEQEPGSGCGHSDLAALERYVGQLGDQAMSLSLEAQKAVDHIVEPEAAVALAIMAAAALQAAATRLWMLPPSGIEEAECRRVALAMLTQSLQLTAQASHLGAGASGAVHGGSSGCLAYSASSARLQAHAHLTQSEIQVESRTSYPGGDRSQLRQQRATAWHLDRASTALHGATDAGAATLVLLAHIHLAHAESHRYPRGAPSGGTGVSAGLGGAAVATSHGAAGGTLVGPPTSRRQRQCERALEDILAGCRVLGAVLAAVDTSDAGSACGAEMPAAIRCAHEEASNLLLQRLRSVLRELCELEARGPMGEPGQVGGACWKELYRAALQLHPHDVASAPEILDSCRRKDRPAAASKSRIGP